MLDFLNFLEDNNVHYFITKYSSEELTATLTLVGVRVEVTFSVDDMSFSVFKGSEDVLLDEKALYDLIKPDLM